MRNLRGGVSCSKLLRRPGWTVRLPWHGGHGRRPRGGPEPVPREGDLGERPGLGQSGRGRLVEPNVGPRRRRVRRPKPAARATDWVVDELRPRASRDDLQSEGLASRVVPSSRRGSPCRPVPPIAARR